jgi:hypothetical protein
MAVTFIPLSSSFRGKYLEKNLRYSRFVSRARYNGFDLPPGLVIVSARRISLFLMSMKFVNGKKAEVIKQALRSCASTALYRTPPH